MRFVFAAVTLALLTAFATVADARTFLSFSPEGDLESIEVQNNVEDEETIQSVLGEFGNDNVDGWSCTGLTCQCCQRVKISKIHLDENCCLKVTYRPSDGMVIVALTIGSHNVWNISFPVGRLPSNCIDLPFIFLKPKVCVGFYSFHLDSKGLSGCARLVFKLFGKVIVNIDLKCFNIKFIDLPEMSPQADFAQLVRAMKMNGGNEATELIMNEDGGEHASLPEGNSQNML